MNFNFGFMNDPKTKPCKHFLCRLVRDDKAINLNKVGWAVLFLLGAALWVSDIITEPAGVARALACVAVSTNIYFAFLELKRSVHFRCDDKRCSICPFIPIK